jgi:hypothetical protein
MPIFTDDVGFEKSADMQGSLQTNLEPSRCLDGWSSPWFEPYAVFRTAVNDAAIYKWMMVDFGTTYQIRKVSLTSVMYFDYADKRKRKRKL